MFVRLGYGLEAVGRETDSDFVMQCQENCTDRKNEGLRDSWGRAEASCNVNIKAYYFHSIHMLVQCVAISQTPH